MNGKGEISDGDSVKGIDSGVTIEELQRKMAEFTRERDWDRFHSPRNLLLALVKFMLSNIFNKFLSAPLPIFATWIYTVFHLLMVSFFPLLESLPALGLACSRIWEAATNKVGEVGELSEIFQWKGEVPKGLPDWDSAEKEHLGEELSDVLLYLVRLADICGVDLGEAALRKVKKNCLKYPVETCKGSSKKYTHYANGVNEEELRVDNL